MLATKSTLSWEGKTAVITVKGSINVETAGCFENKVREARKKTNDIIMDFSGLEAIATIGLSVLIAARNDGANIVIAGPNANIRRVFEVVGLAKVFKCVETIGQAKNFF